MRRTLCVALAAGLLLSVVQRARADDQAKAVVEKAIKATGGEAKLAKFKAYTSKAKGKFYGFNPEGSDFTAESAVQLPNRSRSTLQFEMNWMKVEFVRAVDGDKGWVNFGGMVQDVPEPQLKEAREDVYHEWVTTLLPLRDKAFTLSSLEEIKVDDRPAAGLKVSHEGYRDLSLYFDKASGLLVKAATKSLNFQGEEVDAEVFFSDYKDVAGVKQPMKVLVNQAGQKLTEQEVVEIKPHEKLDDELFAKPK